MQMNDIEMNLSRCTRGAGTSQSVLPTSFLPSFAKHSRIVGVPLPTDQIVRVMYGLFRSFLALPCNVYYKAVQSIPVSVRLWT